MKKDILSKILYSLGILLCIFFFFTKSILFIILSVIVLLISSLTSKNKNKLIIYTLLVIYFIGLSYFILYAPLLGRTGIFNEWNFNIFKQYIENSINIIPFKTISQYLAYLFNYKLEIATEAIFLNLLGNLLCLTPLAILLPLSFEKLKKGKFYILVILIISLLIEFSQLITMSGIFDIDDIILNASGAILAFLIVRPEINNFVENLMFKKEHKIKIKPLILKSTIIIFLGIIFICAYQYREMLTKNYWLYIYEYDIKIEYKTNSCDNNIKEYIYEDEYYKYYLICHSPKDTTIYLNNKPYTVEKVFSNELEYHINIANYIYAGLTIISEDKYEVLKFCDETGSFVHFFANASEIVEFTNQSTGTENNQICSSYSIIPLKPGEDKLSFDIEKNGQKIKTYTYEFIVSEDMKVSYKLISES